MVTLADVAKEAHVSKMTVSRVINHPEKVTKELQKIVFEAMAKLDYQPNLAARALASHKTRIIKLFILEEMTVVEPYYMTLLVGISKQLEKHGYTLQVTPKLELNPGLCDGYIITGLRELDYSKLAAFHKPLILFGDNRHGYDFVDNDNYEGLRLATHYALKCGYEHLVYVGTDIEEPFELKRRQGYLDVLAESKLASELYFCANHSHVAANLIKAKVAQWQANTCFICASDRIALGVSRALKASGKAVGEDFGVIGHDGVFLDQVGDLTTIKQPILEMGQALVEILLAKINGQDSSNYQRIYKSKLVVRTSTRKETDAYATNHLSDLS
ncbi:LacI family DNA-binding transcriptional regulator [Ligilactobacillus agilis]|uniref:LacI family DNA-binding transcriptional regulator n=1 Tax=Ligilactobacillus agilis TaxID=1601 RepID=UPI002550F445|nr:LacI family DNA-binding transcriptional regulator [Ligilactobacillus agilis]MDK6809879.1 LacI family DNA-binding transcriptional regulator [Ligilactobacillus agilis]